MFAVPTRCFEVKRKLSSETKSIPFFHLYIYHPDTQESDGGVNT